MCRPALLVALTVLVAAAACSQDKVLTARKVLREEPAEAVKLLLEAQKERGGCLECSIYLGLAYELLGDLEKAASAYEDAVEAQNPWSRPEPVPAKLLQVYKKLFDAKRSTEEKLAVARKAAVLEKRLKVAEPWANRYLFEDYYKRFSLVRDAGKTKEALELVKKIENLYLPIHVKKRVADEATRLMESAFVTRGLQVLRGPVGEKLRQAGLLSEDGAFFSLVHKIRIPSPKENPQFDPKSPSFPLALRSEACLPLRKELEKAVRLVEPILGLKGLDSKALDGLFAKIFKHARAGYATLKPNPRRPAGQPYLCMISLPVEGFLKELFPFSEPR